MSDEEQNKDRSFTIRLNIAIIMLIGLAMAGGYLAVRLAREKRPQDVDRNVTASTAAIMEEFATQRKEQQEFQENIDSQLTELRQSVNHSRELAAENKAIISAANKEISDLKRELIDRKEKSP